MILLILQTEGLRNCYDSYKMLTSAKNKKYLSRTELALINGQYDDLKLGTPIQRKY